MPLRVIWLLCAAFLPSTAMSMVPENYSPVHHDRFATWNPVTSTFVPNENPAFVGAGYDWSGIIWRADNVLQNRALISPRHSIGANHVTCFFSQSVLFGTNGYVVLPEQVNSTRFVGHGYLVGGQPDLGVGVAASAMSPNYGAETYGFLDLGTLIPSQANPSPYLNQDVFLVGHGNGNPDLSPRVARVRIKQVTSGAGPTSTSSSFRTDWVDAGNGSALQGQDSGGPALMGWTDPAGEKQLAVLGTHSAVSSRLGQNYHNFLARDATINAVNNILVEEGFALRMLADPAAYWTGAGTGFGDTNQWTTRVVPDATRYAGFSRALSASGAVDLAAGTAPIRGLIAVPSATPGGFAFSNGAINLGRGGIVNYSSAAQTFASDVALQLTDHQIWDARKGDIVLQGGLNLSGRLLAVRGEANTTIAGVVTDSAGNGPGLSKDGAGTLTLGAPATYAGSTWVYDGTLAFSGAGNLPAGTRLFMANQDRARLALDGRTATVARLNSIVSDGRGVIDLGNGGTLVIDQASNTGNSLYNAAITGGVSSTDALVVRGAVVANSNTVRLGGNSDFAGRLRIEGTWFGVTAPGAFGAGGAGNETIVHYSNLAGGTNPSFNVLGSGTYTESLHLVASTGANLNATILDFNAPEIEWAAPITLVRDSSSAAHTINWTLRTTANTQQMIYGEITGALAPGAVAGTGNANRLQIDARGPTRLAGTISSGTIGGSGVFLDYRGSARTEIHGTNTYTHLTYITASNVVAMTDSPHGAPGAFGNATSAVVLGLFNAPEPIGLYAGHGVNVGRTLNVNSASDKVITVGVHAGDAAEFSGTMEMRRGVRLAAGAGGIATFSGPIQHVSGTSAVEIHGPGTVVLSASNNFSGGTTVKTGKLLVGNAMGSGTGTGNVVVENPAVLGGTGTIAGGLEIQGGATFERNLQSTNLLTVQGGVTIGSGATLRIAGPPDTLPGNYPILSTATFGGSFTGLDLPENWVGQTSGNTFTLLARTRVEAWRQQYFSTWQNAGIAADGFDINSDGVVNLMVYALGAGDPFAPALSVLPVLGKDGNFLTLTFPRTADPNLVYIVRASDDLGGWQNIWTSTGAQNVAGPVTVTDIVPAVGQRFLRLLVTWQP